MLRIIRFIMGLLLLVALPASLQGQSLQDQLEGVFEELLGVRLGGSPGAHGEHFKPSNVANSGRVINTLNKFISSSVSNFPLSSTVAGVTFDFSGGRPVSTSTSLGPVFAERAQTLGRSRFNFGINFSHLNFTKIRGLDTDDIRLTFTHQNVGNTEIYGDSPFEFDTINLFLNLKVRATVFALVSTYGVTDRLDIGVAIPFVNVRLKANPVAYMDSYTYLATGQAFHSFGGTPEDPILTTEPEAIDDDATGLGDIALRLKYNFVRDNEGIDLAALVEYRLDTGEEPDFLGTGDDRIRLMLIASKVMGNFAPHLNIGYEMKTGKLDRDEVEVYLGYDQKITEDLTLAIDFLGEYQIGEAKEENQFPDPIAIEPDGLVTEAYVKQVSFTNIPNFKNDHNVNGSVGFKWAPKESVMITGNVIVPLNDGGLRADFIPTLGFEFSF